MKHRVDPASRNLLRRPLAAGLAVALALTLGACGGPGSDGGGEAGAERAVEAVAVEVAQVSRQPVAANYSGTASLEAAEEAQVVSKTNGVLLELRVEEGDTVTAGQLLARLDPDRKGLALTQARAQLTKLQSEYNRSGELFSRQLVSADQHERLRSELEIQRAAVDIAELELSYTRITAPINGVIAERTVKQGNLIQTNQSLFRIVDAARLEAVLNIPERQLGTMRPELPVSMQVDAVPGERFEGRISRVSPVVDAGSGTFRVTAEFLSDGRLRPGMFGRVEVVYDQRIDVLTVPRAALVEGDGMASVFAVRDGQAVRVPVELGHLDARLAEIRSGIEEGEQVVTVGKVTLRDGSPVQVLNAPAASAGGPAEGPVPDAATADAAEPGAAAEGADEVAGAGAATTAQGDEASE